MLIFEKSVKGRTGVLLDECDVPAVALNAPRRAQEARLPEVSEIDVIRHYTALSKKAHGVDDGFYPLDEVQSPRQRRRGGIVGLYARTSFAGL